MKPAPGAPTMTAEVLDPTEEAANHRGFDLTALAALAVLTLRQHLRGRRLLVLSLLFLLPSVLAAVVRIASHPPPAMVEFVFVFNLIPHVLAPLTALLYAAGIIQDEVEEQTLTYLLVRPLPRWALYVTRLVVTWLVTSALTAAFTLLAFVVIYWDTAELWTEVLPARAPQTVALMALAQAGYCALFGAVGLLTRWSLLVGLGYIIIFEGMLASFEFVLRRLTVMYYFRVLSLRWMNLEGSRKWSLDLATAPSAGDCVLTLLGVSAAFMLLGAVLTMRREFRMKTPEGS
jgi:ABC-2 type transport system permease protein